jgi:hypothetical protein
VRAVRILHYHFAIGSLFYDRYPYLLWDCATANC